MPSIDTTYYDSTSEQLNTLVAEQPNISNEAENKNANDSEKSLEKKQNETIAKQPVNSPDINANPNRETPSNNTPNTNNQSAASNENVNTPSNNSTTNNTNNNTSQGTSKTSNQNQDSSSSSSDSKNSAGGDSSKSDSTNNTDSNNSTANGNTENTNNNNSSSGNTGGNTNNNNSSSGGGRNANNEGTTTGGNNNANPGSNTGSNSTGERGSYTDQVSANLALSIGKEMEGLKGALDSAEQIANNENLSSDTANVAQALNVAEAGVQAFGAITGALENLVEGAILPILGALGMKGIASFPVSRQMDPVMAIDVHMVVIPPSPAPVPMPHPYIGMLLRPKDFISVTAASLMPPPPAPPDLDIAGAATDAQQAALNANKAATLGHTAATIGIGMIGATVSIGGLPRVVAGTPTKSIPHFPMGAGFHPGYSATVTKNKGHAFLGSLLTLADEDPISGGALHMHLNCNDVGIFSPHTTRPSKNTDGSLPAPLQLFLPTGFINSIPMAKTVLTNPVPAPFNPMGMLLKPMKAAFGRLFKKQKKKVADKLHDAVNSKIKSGRLRNAAHKAICKVTGHPVDVATGMFFTDEEDFYLASPIPLTWERTWYSKSDYKGPLGNGWHHNYDLAIIIDSKTDTLTLRLPDGRPIAFKTPLTDKPSYNKAERMEMRVNDKGEYYVWDVKEDLYYYFTNDTYEELQLLRSVVNTNGFSIQFKYDFNGYLTQIIDSAHRFLNVENDFEGRIIKIEAPHPKIENQQFTIASYRYNHDGNMISQTNAVGDSMHFEYKGNLMVKEIWRNGLTWHFRYDGKEIGARCVHTWGDNDIYNHKLTFEKGKTIVENSLGNITTYFHKGGLVYKQIDPNEAEHQWLYDEDNQLISETDPMGNCYMYSYDDFGNRIETIDPTGASETTEFSNVNQPHLPTEAQDANGGKWQWEYDEQGNVIKRINPMGATSLMDYNDGLLQTITDELANTTDLQYDAQYNIVTIADNQNNQSTYRYDELGRATKITNPKGAIQNRAFDLAGRIIEVNDFDDNQIKLQYDGIDNLLKYKDDQQEVEYSYSGMWKLTKRTDQRGTTNYYYDTEEQLTKITNENGRPYIFTLDEVGNVLKEQSFDGSVKKYKRDLAGRVTQLTKASKKTVNYKYDLASRITEIMHPDGDRQSFEYNGAGQLIKATNKDAEVEFKRNQLGLISEENVGEHTITNEYNYSGRRTNLQSSLGANLNFEHDNFGNLAHLKVAQGNTQWQADYNYDSLGFELDRLLPGNLKQSFTYDAIGRLTQQQTHLNRKENKKLKHRRRYTWGKNDRLLSTNDSKQGITAYEYSPTGHLQKTTFADGKTQHRLADSVGNLYEQTNKHDRTYGAGGRLEKKGSWNYEYDKDGFLIEKYKGNQRLFSNKKEHWKYNWNNEGMLQSVNQPDGETVSFTYDALGRRLSKTFKNTVTKWLWDGNTPLHEWKESLQTGEILSNSGVDEEGIITWVFEENTFIPTAKLKGNKKYSILADQLGTPSQMYNDEGETVWERSLDSFGKPNYQTGKQGSCPFMYQGQYEDVETGLYYNRFRYYDAEDGRYISQDPIGLLSGEFGFYNYVDDSNSLIDVFGLDTVYSRKRDHKNEGNLKPYVGSAKNGVKKRYSKKELEGKDGKDHFTTPNHDITRGLEQIIFERGRDKKGKDYWDNINNPVSPSHIGGVKYKDNMDKYTYRKTKAEEFMKKKYGDNWKNKIDEAFGF